VSYAACFVELVAMGNRPEHIITRLRDAGQQTLAFWGGLVPEQGEMQIYAAGAEWNARQVLCHFISAERNLLRLFENIMMGGEGVPADFDIDQFNANDVASMGDCQMEGLLATFSETRAALVGFVEGLSEADLDRVGRHPFLGMVTLEKMLKLIYRHNMLHQKDIQKVIETGHPIPSAD
jgi:hypothetical protein